MSQETRQDGVADACATIAIIVLVVGTVTFWLHSMPG
ncbi:MAG TPA: methionine synthase [Spongiibacteraceae bacterium]|nr:methionine synthase [Spongiibacteraceae bacterium]